MDSDLMGRLQGIHAWLAVIWLAGGMLAPARGESFTSPTQINPGLIDRHYFTENALKDDLGCILTADGHGTAIAVWPVSSPPSSTNTFLVYQRSTDNGVTWDGPCRLDNGSADAYSLSALLAVVTDGAGTWLALFTVSIPVDDQNYIHKFYMARSVDNGQSWSAPVSVIEDADYLGDLSAACAGGTWIITYVTTRLPGGSLESQPNIAWLRSTDGGQNWSTPQFIDLHTTTSSDLTGPTIAGDAHGNWLILWSTRLRLNDTVGTDADLVGVRSTDNGQSWSARFHVNSDADADDGHDLDVHLSTDTNGLWMAVWMAKRPSGPTGGDFDILFSTSTDLGQHWSNPQALNPNALTDQAQPNHDEGSPLLAHDGHQTWMVSWRTDNPLEDDGDQVPVAMTSTNGGADWSAPALIDPEGRINPGSTNNERDFNLAAVGENGFLYLRSVRAFDLNLTGDDYDLVLSRTEGSAERWTGPVIFNHDAYAYELGDRFPALDTDGQGTWVAVWQFNDMSHPEDGLDEDVMFAHSSDNGVTWSGVGALNSRAASDSLDRDLTPQLAYAGADVWLSIWSGQVNGGYSDIYVARSTDNGTSFPIQKRLNYFLPLPPGSGQDNRQWDVDDTAPSLASDRQGNSVVVWQTALRQTLSGATEIVVSRSEDGGSTWTEAQALIPSRQSDVVSDKSPTVATDGSGTWLAAWQAHNYPDFLDPASYNASITCARSTDAGANWTLTGRPHRAAVGSNPWQQGGVALANDGHGHWLAVWRCNEDIGGTIHSHLAYAMSANDGTSWTSAQILDPTAGSTGVYEEYPRYQGVLFKDRPGVAAYGDGRWAVAWSTNQGVGLGEDWDVLIAYSIDNGASWTTPESLNPNAATDASNDQNVRLYPDSAGGLFAVWRMSSGIDLAAGSLPGDRVFMMNLTPARNAVRDWLLFR